MNDAAAHELLLLAVLQTRRVRTAGAVPRLPQG